GSHLAQETGELPSLIPRRESERHVAHTGVEAGAEVCDALLGAARYRPSLHEPRAELRRVVRVEERLALFDTRLAILVDVDVAAGRAAHAGGVAPFVARHRGDTRLLTVKLVWRQLVGHPAIGQARHATIAPFDDRVGGARASLPGEAGGIARDPHRTRILDGM